MTFESFGDLVLQRLDSFDLNTRNMLNIGSVIGLSFSLNEVVAVQMRLATEGKEELVRKLTVNSLQAAVDEGILECRKIVDEGEVDGNLKYSFYHSIWRTSLLSLMLDGRKRDLHRTIAEAMEQESRALEDYMFQTKLFNHLLSHGKGLP